MSLESEEEVLDPGVIPGEEPAPIPGEEPAPIPGEEPGISGSLETGDSWKDEGPELTSEELEAAFGRRLPGWAIPAGITALAALLVVIVWSVGGRQKQTAPGEEEMKPVAEAVVDTIPAAGTPVAGAVEDSAAAPVPSVETVAAITQKGLDGIVEISRAEMIASTDSITLDSALELPPADLFNQLLNAEITPEETQAFSKTPFDEFLLTPVVPVREARGVAGLPHPAEIAGAQDTLSAILYSVIDSMHVFTRIDSLEENMTELRTRLGKSEELTDELRKELELAAVRADSMRTVEIKKLAKIVDVMKPAYAATMLSDKKDRDIKDVLFRLKPRNAAKLLENFPPDRRSRLASSIVRR